MWSNIVVILFLVSGVLTLNNYGLTWDEGLGNLFFGERYARYFSSFNQKYLDFNADLKTLSNYPLHLFLSPFHDRPNEFPPVADTFSAASMYLFGYGLKWLNPIDAFHLFTVILAAIFLWVLYRFAEPRLGKFASLMAILLLGTFPRFWADMHFNVKDVPETIFFGLVLMTYWWWYEKPTKFKALGAGVLMGCALNIKANAIFIIPVLLLSIIPLSSDAQAIKKGFLHFIKYFWHYGLMAASTILVYLLSWPYLYTNTWAHLKTIWSFNLSQGGRNIGQLASIYPIRETLTTMPEFMLLAFGIGLVLVVRQAWRDKSPFWRLLLLWTIIPILRSSIFGAINFDGIRHFLEFLPAASLIAGYGLSSMVNLLVKKKNFHKLVLQTVSLALLFANLMEINMKYYPFLHLYYNEFVGGFSGARDKFLHQEASDYWASSYRQGMEWLNQNAAANSSVAGLIAPWIVNLSAPVLLRQDIRVISELPDFKVMSESREAYYLMFILRNGGEAHDEIDYTIKHGKLVFQIAVDQVPILDIFQFGGD